MVSLTVLWKSETKITALLIGDAVYVQTGHKPPIEYPSLKTFHEYSINYLWKLLLPARGAGEGSGSHLYLGNNVH